MLATPSVPVIPVPANVKLGALFQFPVRITLDPVVLTVLLALVGIFVATLSVMLIYHWRRFPYETDLFARVERWYLAGVFVLLAVAVLGIFIS